MGNFRTSSLGVSISSNPERTALRRRRWGGAVWGASYIEVLQERAGSLNIKRLLLIKGNHISQVKEFSAFLCMGRCKSLGSLKSFLWYAPQLSGASILCFHTLSFLRAHRCREWLQSDGSQMAGILSFLSSLRDHQITSVMAAIADECDTIFFTDMAGNTPFHKRQTQMREASKKQTQIKPHKTDLQSSEGLRSWKSKKAEF